MPATTSSKMGSPVTTPGETPGDDLSSTIPRTTALAELSARDSSYFTSRDGHAHTKRQSGGHRIHPRFTDDHHDEAVSGTVVAPVILASDTITRPIIKISPGAAATIALRDHRPVEVWTPDKESSAGLAATRAVREHKSVELQPSNASSFASTAATLAHGGHPNVVGTARNDIENTLVQPIHGRIGMEDDTIAAHIHSAAAISVAKSKTQNATGGTLPRRRIPPAKLEEAARKAAARRLALLDQELYEAGSLPRIPLPYAEPGPGTERMSPRAGAYPLRDGFTTVRAQRPTVKGSLDGYGDLMAIAKRNVENRMAGLDLQVAERNGLVYRKDWKDQALKVAEARSQSLRRPDNRGKIDVGGGSFVDAAVVDAIALRNVQPVLDDITAKAEAERARVAAERADAEERKRAENVERELNRGLREAAKKAKGDPYVVD